MFSQFCRTPPVFPLCAASPGVPPFGQEQTQRVAQGGIGWVPDGGSENDVRAFRRIARHYSLRVPANVRFVWPGTDPRRAMRIGRRCG